MKQTIRQRIDRLLPQRRSRRIVFYSLFILLSVLFWLLVWELIAWRVGNSLLFPTPRRVLQTLLGLMQTKDFYLITWRSVRNILLGILYALLCGGLLSAATYALPPLRLLLLPLMTVIKATPVASFIVLLLIWIGSPKVPTLITFLIVLPVVWTNLDEGLNRQDKQLLEVAQVYRMPFLRRLRLLTLPSVRPYFVSACRTSLGLAWKAGIAAEIIAMPRHSIGTMIGTARQYLETEVMFAWTLTVILLSLLFEFGFVALLDRIDRKNAPKKEDA